MHQTPIDHESQHRPSQAGNHFGRLKNELFYSRDWLDTTIDEFITKHGSL
jgi:hypothetical protein